MDEKLNNAVVEESKFAKEIGVFGGVSLLGGIMIGSGVFYLGSYVLQRAGYSLGWACICWLIGGLVSLLGGLCYAELGAAMPKAGGMTVALGMAYHPVVGFMNGFNSWISGGPGSLSGVAVAFATLFGMTGVVNKGVASIILIVFTIFNLQGVKAGNAMQNITMIAKLVPLFIIIISALAMGGVKPDMSLAAIDGSTKTAGETISMIAFATQATLWAYEGWTNLNSVAEEMKNPKRDLPLAILIAIGGIALLYTLFNYSIYHAITREELYEFIEAGSLYMGTETATRCLGAAGGFIVKFGMAVSMLGSINGMTLAFPRVPYAMATGGHFFNKFATLNDKKVPAFAMWIQLAWSLAFVWVRALDQLTNMVTFGGQIYAVLAIVAVVVMRKRYPDMERPYKVIGGYVTIVVAIVLQIAMMAQVVINDPSSAGIGLVIPFIALLVYWLLGKKNGVDFNTNEYKA